MHLIHWLCRCCTYQPQISYNYQRCFGKIWVQLLPKNMDQFLGYPEVSSFNLGFWIFTSNLDMCYVHLRASKFRKQEWWCKSADQNTRKNLTAKLATGAPYLSETSNKVARCSTNSGVIMHPTSSTKKTVPGICWTNKWTPRWKAPKADSMRWAPTSWM